MIERMRGVKTEEGGLLRRLKVCSAFPYSRKGDGCRGKRGGGEGMQGLRYNK